MGRKCSFRTCVTCFAIFLTSWLVYVRMTSEVHNGSSLRYDETRAVVKKARNRLEQTKTKFSDERLWKEKQETIHIAIVVCLSRLEQSLVMIKSLLLFSQAKLVFHIFADKELQEGFQKSFDLLPREYQEKFSFYIYDVSFPNTSSLNSSRWRLLGPHKPCTTERLFLHSLLPDVDALIYLDTDIVLLSPVDDLWTHFSRFNSTQMVGAAPAREYPNKRDKIRKIPIPGGIGMNAGVLLMNLTRIRATTFLSSIDGYLQTYSKHMWYADQDLLNIYFYFHPHQFFGISCQWNYCTDHCHMETAESECKAAEESGVRLLHGTRSSFEKGNRMLLFSTVFKAFEEVNIKADEVH